MNWPAVLDRWIGKESLPRRVLRPVVRAAFSAYYAPKGFGLLWRTHKATVSGASGKGHAPDNVQIGDAAASQYNDAVLQEAATSPAAPGIGTSATGNHVVMIVVSDLRIDPRVEREAKALSSSGFRVTVVCPDPTQGAEPNLTLGWEENIEIRFVHWSAASYVMDRPGFIGSRLFDEVKSYKPFAFHAHDLNTAYIGLAAARTTGAHLIVDFHEWCSENVHWDVSKAGYAPYPEDWKFELKQLEARCLREASAVVTVCDSIADAMAIELGNGRRPVVIRNIPSVKLAPTREYAPLKQQLSIPDERFVLLWQGGTGPTRLIEPIIEALKYAPECTLVIRGPSLELFGDDYRKIASRAGASSRLVLQPPVPSRDVVAAARGADAGIWTLPALCRNFTYALPNKIFEYMASGLPVLAAHHPEATRLVKSYQVGETFDPYDPRSIAAAINRLVSDTAFRTQCRANIEGALSALDADNEWARLVAVYRDLLHPPGKMANHVASTGDRVRSAQST